MEFRNAWLQEISRTSISERDPLRLDAFFTRLPELNSKGDSGAILHEARNLDLSVYTARQANLADSIAAMRDLGMMVCSLNRHGVSAPGNISGLSDAMLGIAERTGMIPRETVLHYCWWNPEGDRQRMFTGATAERSLISSTASSLPAVESAARITATLIDVAPSEPGYSILCSEAVDQLARLSNSVHLPSSGLDARHFADELRHYFLPAEVGHGTYHSAAAAQIPLYLVDQAVWGSDQTDPHIQLLWEDLALYGLPVWRSSFRKLSQAPSLVHRMAAALRGPSSSSSVVHNSATSLMSLIRTLIEFRGRHRRLVRTAYERDSRFYHQGSAGATPELIDQLLFATRECIESIKHGPAQRRVAHHAV
ncbi:monodechloroaminopyrrolnitrin synthase PrnB family protein [Streptomyces sp. NPDC015127]|uniref:monodechloroaminopyrrolnitrin synthase PrnB family protein n=1 Tax=Streptomyces sp. NPDC015127 TaxID=3364939 RepID=UPI0036F71FB3